MSTKLIEALKRHQDAFSIDLSPETMERLDSYYRKIQEHNPVLHLVGKCSEEEFAVRHILESIHVLSLSGKTRTFVDVGSGAGLPGIPCLIASDGLRGFLVESKPKKARFLEEAVETLGLGRRCEVINRQFAEIRKPNAGVVFCRAIDKLAKKLPQLVDWSGNSTLVLFAGEAVRQAIEQLNLKYDSFLIPESERRFLFFVETPASGRRKT